MLVPYFLIFINSGVWVFNFGRINPVNAAVRCSVC
jgi:hypothetical protein